MPTMKLDVQPAHTTNDRAMVVSSLSPIADLVARRVVDVPAATTIRVAVETMERGHVSALLVTEGGGIVTERDVARALGHDVSLDERVAVIATPHPVTVHGSMTVVEACGLMLSEELRHLVVETDAGMAVVSMRDLAAVLLQSAEPTAWLTQLRVSIDVPAETWLG
jgi:CBS domain-containing protein